MWRARANLVNLWLSQTVRVVADNALRFFVVLDYAQRGVAERNGAWHLATALLMWPAVVLAPLNGALCNSLPKRWVLVGSAAFGLLVMAGFTLTGGPWLWAWGLIALSAAVYGPVRYALLPAAAEDTHWSLPRINSFIETGGAAAIIAGLMLGLYLSGETLGTWPVVVVLVLVLHGLTVLFALPVRFPSDRYRHEPAGAAVRDFFRDARMIWREPEARTCLLGLAGLRGLITGMVGALLPAQLDGTGPGFEALAVVAGWVMGGVALGSLLTGLQPHPRRVLSFVPFGATGLTGGLAVAAAGAVPGEVLCVVFGVMAGFVNVPLAATYQAALPPEARGNGMAVRNFADYVCNALAAGILFTLTAAGVDPGMGLWLIAAVAGTAALTAWWVFRREAVEQVIEFLFAVMYRFRAAGPGLDSFPRRGPVLVIANHSAWLDPMWLAKVLPQTMVPMMTSAFFDLPALRWSMIHLFDAIRVQEARFRREVPELKNAVAALDRGKCLVIFPEGGMRRTEDRPLKQFGQGVWHILRERPETPVVVVWIEGGWGSFFSYSGGKPTKNKRLDFRRPLAIAVGEPQTLPPDLMADQRQTRAYLMRECLRTREYLGLPALSLPQFESAEEASDEATA